MKRSWKQLIKSQTLRQGPNSMRRYFPLRQSCLVLPTETSQLLSLQNYCPLEPLLQSNAWCHPNCCKENLSDGLKPLHAGTGADSTHLGMLHPAYTILGNSQRARLPNASLMDLCSSGCWYVHLLLPPNRSGSIRNNSKHFIVKFIWFTLADVIFRQTCSEPLS